MDSIARAESYPGSIWPAMTSSNPGQCSTRPWQVGRTPTRTITVILTALPDQRWRVYLRPSSPGSDLVADASSTVSRYFPTLRFEGVTSPTRFHCHTKVATQFRSRRVLLAGDAAHVCSPAQGLGMNSGLQDAVNLAWKLALVCHGSCSPALLDSYEAERRPVAEQSAPALRIRMHASRRPEPNNWESAR